MGRIEVDCLKDRVVPKARRGFSKLSRIFGGMSYDALDYPKHKLLMYGGVRKEACAKEPETVRWIEWFGETDVAYDIGASVGPYSLIMSKYAGEVYAFEPAFFNFNLLTKNIYQNIACGNIRNNITPFFMAISWKTSVDSFNYGEVRDGVSNQSLGAIWNYGQAKEGEVKHVFSQKVLAVSLDDFISVFKPPFPNHIKIDTDSNEYSILEGAQKTLGDRRLRSVLVEIMYGRDGDKTVKVMEGHGFRLVEKSTRSTKFGNHIFVRD